MKKLPIYTLKCDFISGFKIRERHHTIEPAIGVFTEETETYNLVSLLMLLLPIAVSLGSLLDIGIFYVYNKMCHPWSAILAEEKPAKNWLSRVWMWCSSCVRGEKESDFLGKIDKDSFL